MSWIGTFHWGCVRLAKITSVRAREVLDSRGRPTVEVDVVVDERITGRAIVPSGASTGVHEALELRDGESVRYRGRGVIKAVGHVNNELAEAVVGQDPRDQAEIDRTMIAADGTPTKSRLGANAILGVSLAVARAAALIEGLPLYRYLGSDRSMSMPVPMVNMISGGKHSENNLEMQDFLAILTGPSTYREALSQTVGLYESLRDTLIEAGVFTPGVADEGGFGPHLDRHEQALDLLMRAFEREGLRPGEDAFIALDVAATEFYEGGQYVLATEERSFFAEGMVQRLREWCEQYPIISIEDGLSEDDFDGWEALTAALGSHVQLIGDDLFTTNPKRLAMGIERGIANSVLVKVNQVGTLTETLAVVEAAQQVGYTTVISARSGETEDPFIADLAVGTGAGQIKIGSITRSERTAKYNQLLRIEEEMGDEAPFDPRTLLARFL